MYRLYQTLKTPPITETKIETCLVWGLNGRNPSLNFNIILFLSSESKSEICLYMSSGKKKNKGAKNFKTTIWNLHIGSSNG